MEINNFLMNSIIINTIISEVIDVDKVYFYSFINKKLSKK